MTRIPLASRLPVWIRRAISNRFGYFFLPCNRCGRMFGGWEVRNGRGGHMLQPGNNDTQWITCPRCPGHYDEHGEETEENDHWARVFRTTEGGSA